jgi:hypothetical protein
MRLGMIGLGRIGANMVRRLMRSGHTCSGLSHVDCRIHRPPPHGLRIGFSSNGVWRGRFVDEPHGSTPWICQGPAYQVILTRAA